MRKDVGDKFTPKYLKALREKHKGSELIDLNDIKAKKSMREEFEEAESACVLVIRNGCKNANAILTELKELKWDKKAKMRGRVVNKAARYNLCFSDRRVC